MKPTLEEYNQAKSNIAFASRAIQYCQTRKDELIDELAKERESEKSYLSMLEHNKEIVMLYETYEKIENQNKRNTERNGWKEIK